MYMYMYMYVYIYIYVYIYTYILHHPILYPHQKYQFVAFPMLFPRPRSTKSTFEGHFAQHPLPGHGHAPVVALLHQKERLEDARSGRLRSAQNIVPFKRLKGVPQTIGKP